MAYLKSHLELKIELDEQIQLIDLAIAAYDRGIVIEAKNLSLRLRLLLHDSLLEKLQLKDSLRFYDTSPVGLVMTHTGFTHPIPTLDTYLTASRFLPFNEWWQAPILAINKQEMLTRKDLIMTVADQEGGAHTDISIRNPVYTGISKERRYPYRIFSPERQWIVPDVISPTIRQIAHEVRRTLDPNYICGSASIYSETFGLIIEPGVSSFNPIKG